MAHLIPETTGAALPVKANALQTNTGRSPFLWDQDKRRKRRRTDTLARKYGVTERMMRNYNREFENFVKKFYF